ncbi:MAG: MarR family transcriptional regulator [Firmicutes bacterium HGW-Firmicutes-1]|jgi:DNA-binding MarR family transcriptional regulator|nr:MAG: MarR family transcriptional regulator [Firmicutes bacterium HGW-Firmicutes-1]
MSEVNSKQLREMMRFLERRLGGLDEYQKTCCEVTMAQCHAVVEIGRKESIALIELAELLKLDNSTMSRTVNNLVNKDLVKRVTNQKDRRYVTISLTEKGQNVYESIEKDMDSYYEKVFKDIPENKRIQLIESLQNLIEALDINKR